jgi:hypothetical protein
MIPPMADIAAEVSRALALHQENRMDEAAEIYLRVLEMNPAHADALHLYGLICAKRGKHAEAAERILAAIRIHPRSELFHRNLGFVFQQTVDEERARICFNRVLQLLLPPGHTNDYLGTTPHLLGGLGTPPGLIAATAAPIASAGAASANRDLYLNLMKRCLLNLIHEDGSETFGKASDFNGATRHYGQDWPRHAQTMIGAARLGNIQSCVADVIRRQIPGDLLEAGVWRGGATIFMRALLKAYGVSDRNVWVADSFQGVPAPNPDKFPQDAIMDFSPYEKLSVSVEQVQENFRRYDLLDSQVKFLPGWFRDTLPAAPIENLAVIRLDGDLYESTMDGLVNLYPRLSHGGYVIIDDFMNLSPVRQAALDYRQKHGIMSKIEAVDWSAVFWRREGACSEKAST